VEGGLLSASNKVLQKWMIFTICIGHKIQFHSNHFWEKKIEARTERSVARKLIPFDLRAGGGYGIQSLSEPLAWLQGPPLSRTRRFFPSGGRNRCQYTHWAYTRMDDQAEWARVASINSGMVNPINAITHPSRLLTGLNVIDMSNTVTTIPPLSRIRLGDSLFYWTIGWPEK